MNAKAFFATLFRLPTLFRKGGWIPGYASEELPLRSELFSADQMGQHGKALAMSHVVGTKRKRDPLLTRLAENEQLLLEACNLLTAAIQTDSTITPAGNWLLDNFYLIEEQIRTARRHLPEGYSWELPRLSAGPSAGLPRVYDIALEIISHGDGRVDPDSLGHFIAEYQSVTVLTLGELWGVPIMLRLALIENLRRVATRIITHRIGRDLADIWADLMSETVQRDPKSLILVIADMARSEPPMSSAFVAELARRLQGQSPAFAMPLHWIEQRLAELGLSVEQLVQSENQQQAADQVSISNSIGSLRSLAATDWHAFVENMSLAERTLCEDPAGVYASMDFNTRDHYRHVLERIAKHSGHSEEQIARHCVDLAREGDISGAGDARTAHVGYFLIDRGLPRLELLCGMRMPAGIALRRFFEGSPLLFYHGPLALMTSVFSAGLILQALADGVRGWLLFLAGALSLLCASQLAVALVNWVMTLFAVPRPLPRMDFSKGVPSAWRTLVVIPTMLSCSQDIEDLVESLEVCFLGNRDKNLRFGLLTDFGDADAELQPLDDTLLQQAAMRIAALNDKYSGTGGDAVVVGDSGTLADRDVDGGASSDIFFLFHRPRCWNPRERVWMGRERKRGKLGDLNALLRSGETAPFSRIFGRLSALSGVKFVITLDTDTQLPRDAARQLIGTMAHPLNRAHFDATARRVTHGYGILQPRVAMSLPASNGSRYAQLLGEAPGIDPYTRTVSDVYQDLFGEGSFIGKGIYDIEAVELALKDRFPDNRILSHDLVEGCYARSGLVSDSQCYEQHPARYDSDVARRRRWIRGDWQVAGWLNRRVPGPAGRAEPNPLSALSQWKIFDNLRRSLVSSGLTLLLLLGWAVLPSAGFWTLAVLSVIFVPALVASLLALFQKSADALLSQHITAAARAFALRVAQAIFALACLPFDAYFSLDAICRTVARLSITQRHLLEWAPSRAKSDNGMGTAGADFIGSCRSMWVAPLIAIATSLYLLLSRPQILDMAAPILALWFVSPLVAWWLGRPIVRRRVDLTATQIRFLRMVSRKTWAYFETFIGPDDHWLPPDNFQESPTRVVAHRTSPTNMGLALLANLSACDFGYISAGRLLERSSRAFATMQGLERHRGHFYNWYDTRSLQPLLPVYVSTVDSGNLAGHLLTLRPGLLALADQPIISAQWLDGLDDALSVLISVSKAPAGPAVQQFQRTLDLALASRPITLEATRLILEQLAASAVHIAETIRADNHGNYGHDHSSDAGVGRDATIACGPDSPDRDGPAHVEAALHESVPEDATVQDGEACAWARTLVRQCRDTLDQLNLLAPWLASVSISWRL